MLTKERLISSLEKLPERFSIDELIEHTVRIEKVQQGLEDIAKGKVNSKPEANQNLSKAEIRTDNTFPI